ncbi:MAG: Dabb family protein [Steroidobacteraceae bacterium]
MVKHLVFWKLKAEALGRDSAGNALLIKQQLEALQGKIPGLLKIEVGMDFVRGDTSFDIALYTELESREALTAYLAHPLHKAAGAAFREAISERRSVDYEI